MLGYFLRLTNSKNRKKEPVKIYRKGETNVPGMLAMRTDQQQC